MNEAQSENKDVLREKVIEYKKAHPEDLHDLDFDYLLKTLKKANGDSEVKIACNAIDENREWIPGTTVHNVGKVFVADDQRITFTIRKDNKAMTVEELYLKLEPLYNNGPSKYKPVMVELGEGKRVRITELFAHSMVSELWAGLPFDFNLCYTQE